MAIFRCKMCGGTLDINLGTTVAECEYCGTKQTLPRLDDDRKANLYDRANHFRRNNEFDKAMGIYEQILNEDNTDSEAYWSLVLCRYGIEYVEDPVTHKRVPTVNRAQYTSIFADEDYKAALQYADAAQKAVYEEEAKTIDEIQKGILEISSKEEPFDVFICYKETDNNGRRTPDSVLATDLYHQLTQEGFKVFFSRITLEDKLGSAYEPYIFAALNSAKVMVALGTKAEYFNAVWVKNEWSRYLALIRNGAKKTLIPAYRDMDPYDLPEEFSHLQAQDMSKLGFMQDLIRGIKKITGTDVPKPVEAAPAAMAAAYGSNITALLKRGNMALEDQEWDKADAFFEDVLNQDAECAEAYIGKFLVSKMTSSLGAYFANKKEEYSHQETQPLEVPYSDEYMTHVKKMAEEMSVPGYLDANGISLKYHYPKSRYYESAKAWWASEEKRFQNEMHSEKLLNRAFDYATGKLKDQIENGKAEILNMIYKRQKQAAEDANQKVSAITDALSKFCVETDESVTQLNQVAAQKRENDYQGIKAVINKASSISDYEKAKEKLESLYSYKDADALISNCNERIQEIKEAERVAKEKKEAEARKQAEQAAKKRKKTISLMAAIVAICVSAVLIITKVIIPNSNYKAAVALYDEGKYEEAIEAFEVLNGYKDSAEQIKNCKYSYANALFEDGKYELAQNLFKGLEAIQYKDSADWVSACEEAILEKNYNAAIAMAENGQYKDAIGRLSVLGDYEDCKNRIQEIKSTLGYWKQVEIGEEIIFGSYEQDNDEKNGKEDIEWIVLDKTDTKLLVISQKALDCMPYNDKGDATTWENCSLRAWLNDTFVKSAFSADDQKKIKVTKVLADKNPSYYTDPGNDTTDKIFLLSINEVKQYFSTDKERTCKGTAYCFAKGAAGSDKCRWWLRSSGSLNNRAARVLVVGSINTSGDYVDRGDNAIRPALWVNLEP